jgi:hypothetical protein
MARPLPVSIPVSNDIETLRKHVVVNLNSLSLRLSQQDSRTAPMSMNGNRLTDVPDPGNALDAVNLRTLKKYVQGVTHQHQHTAGLQGIFNVVFANAGTATGTGPPYIFFPNRLGSPGSVKVYALGTGAGNTGWNVYYKQGGTGAATKLLASDIILPAATTGPVTVTNFVLQLSFSINDVIYPVVTTAGGATNFSIELQVTP